MRLIQWAAMLVIVTMAAIAPASAQQYRSSTRHFDAEIVNLRRMASGQVLATVVFRSKMTEPYVIQINNNADSCDQAASMIDGIGNDYVSQNCINFYTQRGTSYGIQDTLSRTGINLASRSEATFVFRFETPAAVDDTANNNINIAVPVIYLVQDGNDPWRPSQWGGGPRPTGLGTYSHTLSFYNLTIPFSAPQSP